MCSVLLRTICALNGCCCVDTAWSIHFLLLHTQVSEEYNRERRVAYRFFMSSCFRDFLEPKEQVMRAVWRGCPFPCRLQSGVGYPGGWWGYRSGLCLEVPWGKTYKFLYFHSQHFNCCSIHRWGRINPQEFLWFPWEEMGHAEGKLISPIL